MFLKLCLLVVLSTIMVMAAPTNSDSKEDSLSVEDQWAKFKVDYNRTYKTAEEEAKRFDVFKENLKKVEEHNKKFEAGETTYTLGINDFSDLTYAEFSKTYLMHLSDDSEGEEVDGAHLENV